MATSTKNLLQKSYKTNIHTPVNDSIGTAQDIGGTVTIPANSLNVGDILEFQIVSDVTTPPSGSDQYADSYAFLDGARVFGQDNTGVFQISQSGNQSLIGGMGIFVLRTNGNNVDLIIANASEATGASIGLTGLIGSNNIAANDYLNIVTTAPIKLGDSNVLLVSNVDPTVSHTLKWQILFGGGALGCIVTPRLTRVIRQYEQ